MSHFRQHATATFVDNTGRASECLVSRYAGRVASGQRAGFEGGGHPLRSLACVCPTSPPFLGGQRLDPATDGCPESRPEVRENSRILGDLSRDFDFAQKPRAP